MNDPQQIKPLIEYALDQLLEYAKYLEDNGQLSYELLQSRVNTYKEES